MPEPTRELPLKEPRLPKPVPRWKYWLGIGLIVGGVALLVLSGVSLMFSMFGAPAVIGAVGLVAAAGLIGAGAAQLGTYRLEGRGEQLRYENEKARYKKAMARREAGQAGLEKAQKHHPIPSSEKQKERLALGQDESKAVKSAATQSESTRWSPSILRPEAWIRRRKKAPHSTSGSRPASVAQLGVLRRSSMAVSSENDVCIRLKQSQ